MLSAGPARPGPDAKCYISPRRHVGHVPAVHSEPFTHFRPDGPAYAATSPSSPHRRCTSGQVCASRAFPVPSRSCRRLFRRPRLCDARTRRFPGRFPL